MIMKDLHDIPDKHPIPMTSVSSGKLRKAAQHVHYLTDQIVNLCFIGTDSGQWVLVDAGMPNSSATIVEHANDLFGEGNRPAAILLTHGHFDHVGSLMGLLEKWGEVPVYAHPLEFPYLTGKRDYPEPDNTVEGGMLAKLAQLYPHKAIDITPVLRELQPGAVPGLDGWNWIHTPGHSPGHVSFFRISDRTLIAGDAFVTVRQDSMYKVLVQKEEVHGPPRYLTTDWNAARESVRALAGLEPSITITGHGTHMEGEALRNGLRDLVQNFEELAVPKYGKFVEGQQGRANY